MRRHGLRVHVTDGHGRRVPGGGLGAWLERHAPATARGSVSIALVSDAAMRRLNRTFRGKNTVTDVISFPAERPKAQGPRPKATGPRPKAIERPLALGDIAIATGRAARQARDFGHSTATELRVLALHGLLHLMGYDHEADQGDMRRVEERLRRRAGLPGGLIERAGRRTAASPRTGR